MIQQEGPGWRLARDLSRPVFSVLIGGENWAFELNETEACALASAVRELVTQHRAIRDQLMADESITLELERSGWWVCLDGDRSDWSLRVILASQGADASHPRGLEACWPSPAAKAMAAAMRTLWDNTNDQSS